MSEHIFKYKGYKVMIHTSHKYQKIGGYVEIRDMSDCPIDGQCSYHECESAQQLLRRATNKVDNLIRHSETFDEYNSHLRGLITLHEDTEWL